MRGILLENNFYKKNFIKIKIKIIFKMLMRIRNTFKYKQKSEFKFITISNDYDAIILTVSVENALIFTEQVNLICFCCFSSVKVKETKDVRSGLLKCKQ